MMTPESSVEVQTALGSDIMMAFDECVAYPAEKKYVARSLERTTRWLRRCDDHHRRLETKSAMETGSDNDEAGAVWNHAGRNVQGSSRTKRKANYRR